MFITKGNSLQLHLTMTDTNLNHFPWKKTLRSTFILQLVFLIILAPLIVIVNNVKDMPYLWILFVVWGSLDLLSTIFVWVKAYKAYNLKKRKNEKK